MSSGALVSSAENLLRELLAAAVQWPQEGMPDNPMVTLNRAIAAAMVHAPPPASSCWRPLTPMDDWQATTVSMPFAPIRYLTTQAARLAAKSK